MLFYTKQCIFFSLFMKMLYPPESLGNLVSVAGVY